MPGTTGCTTDGSAPGHPRKAPRSGRRYPRQIAEAAGAPGDRRAVGLARIAYLSAGLTELEAQAIADLGGEQNVTTLRRELLTIGLHAESIALALLAEIAAKAEQSRRDGRVPHLSRYRATGCVATFLDLAARRFREVGLERRARRVDSYVSEVLEREKSSLRAAGAAEGGS